MKFRRTLASATAIFRRVRLSNHRALSVEALEARAVPAVTPFSVSFPVGEAAFDVAAGPDGLLVVGEGGDQPVITKTDFQGQTIGTLNLALPAGFHYATLDRLSDDGRYAEGMANNVPPGITDPAIGAPSRAVFWDLEHPDQPLTEGPEFLRIFDLMNAFTPTASTDGRVRASGVQTDQGTAVAVSVDGVQQLLHGADGQPLIGGISQSRTTSAATRRGGSQLEVITRPHVRISSSRSPMAP